MEIASSMVQKFRRGKAARQNTAELRRELSAKIFSKILAYDEDQNSSLDSREFRKYLQATGDWGTDELYTDENWEENWPIVCMLQGVPLEEAQSRGMGIEYFFRYTERYRRHLLHSDLATMSGLQPFSEDRFGSGLSDAVTHGCKKEGQQREKKQEQAQQNEQGQVSKPPAGVAQGSRSRRKPRARRIAPPSTPITHPSMTHLKQASKLVLEHDYHGAAVEYKRCVELGHNDPARCLSDAGLALVLAEDMEGAIELYTEAIAADPTYGKAWHGRASVYRTKAMFEEASRDMEQAASANPTFERQAKEAKKDLKRAIFVAVRMQSKLRAARARLRVNQRRQARNEADAATSIQARFRGKQVRKDILATVVPETATAMRDAAGRVSSCTSALELFRQAGELLRQQQCEEAAATYLLARDHGYSRPSRCHNGAGLAYMMMDQRKDALFHFDRAYDLDPYDARTLHNRAALYRKVGQFAAADRDAALAFELDKSDPSTQRLQQVLAANRAAQRIQAIARGKRTRKAVSKAAEAAAEGT